MSLLNDMLRDINTRQDGPADALPPQDHLLAGSSLLQRKGKIGSVSVGVFLLVLVTLAAAKFFLTDDSPVPIDNNAVERAVTSASSPENKSPSTGALSPNANTPENVAKTALTAPENAAPAVLPQGLPGDAQQTSTPGLPVNQQEVVEHVAALLFRAEQAYAADRLTSPVADNAYEYYRQIALLMPNSQLAEQGLQKIAKRYLNLTREALAKGDAETAGKFLQRAEFVAPEENLSAVAELQQRIATVAAQTATAAQTTNATQVAAQQPRLSKTKKSSNQTSVAVGDFPVTSAGSADHAGVQINAQWRAANAVSDAEALLQKGDVRAAETQLSGFIAQYPHSPRAIMALLSIQLHKPDLPAAEQLLSLAQHNLSPVLQARAAAQVAVARGDNEAALNLLEKQVSQAQDDEEYRALLAGLYYRTQHYEASASYYRRLLDSFGEKPAYWLGLALALDALRQDASALEAYRRIPNQSLQQAEIKNYVAQRIALLSQR